MKSWHEELTEHPDDGQFYRPDPAPPEVRIPHAYSEEAYLEGDDDDDAPGDRN